MNSLSIPPAYPRGSGRRISPRSMFHGASGVLFWMIRQVFWAFVLACALFGAMFAVFYFGSALPLVARNLIFYPNISHYWAGGFVAIMAIYLFFAATRAVAPRIERLYGRYPILGKIWRSMFWLMMLSLVVGFLYSVWNTKPVKIPPPPTLSWTRPQDSVLLHLVVPSTTKRMATSTGTAPRQEGSAIPFWTTTNLVGTATVKNLGHGRYEIRMLQKTR